MGTRRIRVAFCLDSFAIGGTELNAVRTAEALDRERIDLSIFHLQTHGPLRTRYERLGLRMTHLPISSLYMPRTALQGVRLARQLRREEIDVVHSHDIYCNIFAVPWSRALSASSVIASRRWGLEASRPRLSAANRLSCAFAHRILANSRGVAELLAREDRVPRGKIVEVPNFLDESAFTPVDPAGRLQRRRSLGIPDDAFAVGIVARLSPVKNHELLIQALSRLDARFHLVAVGDGPLRPHLEALARRLGIASRVHFAGEIVPDVNLHQFFEVSALCSRSEGFPNSLIEAMAAGRAVVATPVGGIPDVVDHGSTGLLVPADDPGPLAEALAALEADAGLRERLGEAGRRAVRANHLRGPVIEKLTDLYESLARRARASAKDDRHG